MRAFLAILLLAPSISHAAEGVLSIGTGMRPIGLPVGILGVGGAFRLGVAFGPVTPYIGGQYTQGKAYQVDFEESFGKPVLFSATAGARVDVGGNELLHPYGTANLSIVQGSYLNRYDEDYAFGVSFSMSPALYAGGGLDAQLGERVDLGVELGAAMLAGKGEIYEEFGNTTESVEEEASLFWLTSDVHLTFRFGGGS